MKLQPSRKDRRARRLGFESLEDRRVLSTVTVSTTSDVVDGNAINGIAALIVNPGPDGKISIREAIEAANFTSGANTIQFSPTVFNTPKTITLTQGELSITNSVTIDGTIDGAEPSNVSLGITISAGNGTDQLPHTGDGFGIFSIGAVTVEINSLRLTGGDKISGAGAISIGYGNLTLKNVTISGNAGSEAVKTIDGYLTIEDSEISGNWGRGIVVDSSQYIPQHTSISDSTISGNLPFTAGGFAVDGGGIRVQGFYSSVSIQSSTISGNQSNLRGAGIDFLDGTQLALTSSIIQNNTIQGPAEQLFGAGVNVRASYGALITVDDTTIDSNDIIKTSTGLRSQGEGGVSVTFVVSLGKFSRRIPTDRAR